MGYPITICDKNFVDYGLTDYLRLFWDRGDFGNGNFAPLLCPLWYIRNLFIMCVLSPLFYYLIRYLREVFLLSVLGWWLTLNHNAFIPQTILFFGLGAYFSIFGINPLKILSVHRIVIISLCFVFSFIDIFVHIVVSTPVNLMIHRLALTFNIPVLILLGDHIVRRTSLKNRFLPQTAFIVFCIHYPIVLVLRKVCVTVFSDFSDVIHILLYFLCVILTTATSLGFYWALNNYFPIVKNILSGNR